MGRSHPGDELCFSGVVRSFLSVARLMRSKNDAPFMNMV